MTAPVIALTGTAHATPGPAELLLELLETPSPTGLEARLALRLRARLEELGFESTIDRAGNVVASWGEGPAEVMLVGHLDTVPGDIPVRVEDGIIHGRGAVDAKGPLAAAIAAVMRQPRDGVRHTVVAAVDEEGDSRGAHHLMSRRAPDHLVVLEPSGWDAVTVAYRGSVLVDVEIEQEIAHRAGPSGTAADALLAQLASTSARLRGQNEGRGAFERCEMRVLSLSAAGDGFRERAGARVQFRLPLDVPAERLLASLRDEWPTPPVLRSAVDAVRTPRDSLLARALTRSIRDHGGSPRFKRKTGTADLNLLAPCWGCPAVAYGPGDSRLDHTPQERIEIAELERGTAVLAGALRALAQPAEGSIVECLEERTSELAR